MSALNDSIDLSSSLLKQLTDQTISSVSEQSTVLLYYNSTYSYSSWLLRIMEQLALLCNYQKYQLDFSIIDAYLYPSTVYHYTYVVPTLCLYIHGIPLVYTGRFTVGDIHLWLLSQIQQNCCPTTL